MSVDISDLFAEVFGVRITKAYQVDILDGKVNMPELNFQGIEVITDEEVATQMSSLGTPILFPIGFKGGTYNEYDSNGKITPHIMGDFRLPITAIADFRRSKIKTTTKAVGSGTAVTEIYGFTPWKINIKGFCLPEKNQPQGKITPYEQEEELMVWENLVDRIDLDPNQSFFFKMRNIYSIEIDEIAVYSVRGNPKIRPFQIKAESTDPLELIL